MKFSSFSKKVGLAGLALVVILAQACTHAKKTDLEKPKVDRSDVVLEKFSNSFDLFRFIESDDDNEANEDQVLGFYRGISYPHYRRN